MNRLSGSSLCTFGPDIKADLCHLYLNPDKNNIQNLILTVHLMPEDGSTPDYQKVRIYYEEMEIVKSAINNNREYLYVAEAEEIPYVHIEERDMRQIFRGNLINLKPDT